MNNEHTSCPSIYENILREKNKLLVKIVELQTENDDLKIRLKRFTDVIFTSSTALVQNQVGRTGSGSGKKPSYRQQSGRIPSFQYRNHDFCTYSYHNNTLNLIYTYCMKKDHVST